MTRFKRLRLVGLLGLVAAVSAGITPGARVRLEILALKIEGELPDVSKWDVLPLFKPHAGFDLYALAETRSPYSALTLPTWLAAQSDSGMKVFARRCATCHGPAAKGGIGPSLAGVEDLRHGASDWAMFRVVRDGVPGTAMRSWGLTFDDTWRVIAQIRAFQRAHATDAIPREGIAADSAAPVSEQDLATADGRDADWITYAGGWSGRRNKEMPEITAASLRSLQLAWAHQLRNDPVASQTTPIAVRGLLIVTTAQDVIALSQRDGQVVWRFHHELPADLKLCCQRANRGVGVYGHTVFYGTLDAHLFALDLGTGRVVWDVPVSSPAEGASITGAPMIAEGKVVIGISGSEFGARGFLDAYDPETGKRLWRVFTIPVKGEAGSETWPAGNEARGGGGGAWVTGAYDPKLHLLYWGTGNPSPAYAPDVRPGNNLHTCSVLAIDIRTGTLVWTYQFTPNDSHDWDSGQTPILTDLPWKGEIRPLILWANKNGFFYVLDRRTGEFLRATAFAKQTWNDGFDAQGHPRVRASVLPTPQGVMVYPGNAGATSWWPPSYSQRLGLVFVPVWEGGGWYFRDPQLDRSDGLFTGGRVTTVPGERAEHLIVALDVATGQIRWRAPLLTLAHGAKSGGLLSLGDRLVLGSEETSLVAFDARTGERVWQRNLGADVAGTPMTFRVDGKPRMAVVAGSVLFVFDLGTGSGAFAEQRPTSGAELSAAPVPARR